MVTFRGINCCSHKETLLELQLWKPRVYHAYMKPYVWAMDRTPSLPMVKKWPEEWWKYVPYLHPASTSGNLRSLWIKQQASIWDDLLAAWVSSWEWGSFAPGLMTGWESPLMRKPWALDNAHKSLVKEHFQSHSFLTPPATVLYKGRGGVQR